MKRSGGRRRVKVGSNTAADHVTVLMMALAQLPEPARPRPGDPGSPRVLARSDSAGATHVFAAACRNEGVEFSFGFPVDERVQRIVDLIPERCWHPAIEADGELREGAWVAEATGMIDLSSWPDGSRLVPRKERPHPGARCEIAAFRYWVLHVAAQLTRSARTTRLRIDRAWRWATQIAEGFHRLRAAFA